MDIKVLFANIESESFRQKSQVMNNLASLTSSIKSNDSVNDFQSFYALYPDEGAALLIDRINKLVLRQTNEKYLNKYDAAIATYLYLLNATNREKSRILMSKLKLPTNTWWSKQMLMILKQKEDSKKTVYNTTLSHASPNNPSSETNLESNNSATSSIKGTFNNASI